MVQDFLAVLLVLYLLGGQKFLVDLAFRKDLRVHDHLVGPEDLVDHLNQQDLVVLHCQVYLVNPFLPIEQNSVNLL